MMFTIHLQNSLGAFLRVYPREKQILVVLFVLAVLVVVVVLVVLVVRVVLLWCPGHVIIHAHWCPLRGIVIGASSCMLREVYMASIP